MELLLGSYVREHGNRIGRVAGFELDSDGSGVSRIMFSPGGDLGPQTMTRPPAAVALIHDDGEIELRLSVEEPLPPRTDAMVLTPATRLRHGDRAIGRLAGLELDPSEWRILSVFTRPHWWSRRVSFSTDRLDLSTPGEIRLAPGSRFRAA